MEFEENAKFVYKYTEASYQGVNKSIDIVTGKLTNVLAFSGVLLKFGYEMPSEGWLFSLKFVVLSLLIGAIGLCAVGLRPKGPGNITLTPDYLVEEYLTKDPEDRRNQDIHVLVSTTLVAAIPKLKELRDYRINLLNHAIGCLVLSGIIFGVSGIINGIK